ncbi:hypothetical protein F5I97DRAFT_1409810 [Phlebopus sp. FC_14]|nr:hypothetical protein F5I97DRAFT_1409810 [Phlebopus sp. FC_14]
MLDMELLAPLDMVLHLRSWKIIEESKRYFGPPLSSYNRCPALNGPTAPNVHRPSRLIPGYRERHSSDASIFISQVSTVICFACMWSLLSKISLLEAILWSYAMRTFWICRDACGPSRSRIGDSGCPVVLHSQHRQRTNRDGSPLNPISLQIRVSSASKPFLQSVRFDRKAHFDTLDARTLTRSAGYDANEGMTVSLKRSLSQRKSIAQGAVFSSSKPLPCVM